MPSAFFDRVQAALEAYEGHFAATIAEHSQRFQERPLEEQALFPKYMSNLKDRLRCVTANAEFLKILYDAFPHFCAPKATEKAFQADVERVEHLLRLLVRDWAAEGSEERRLAYAPLLDALDDEFGDDRAGCMVLFPGSGLGRLPLECAARGYDAHANENSAFCAVFATFFLNFAGRAESLAVFPRATAFANAPDHAGAAAPRLVPDLVAAEVAAQASFGQISFHLNDFEETPAELHGRYAAVCTSYFVDAVYSLGEAVRGVARCLRAGGLWVNSGPLHYHWLERNGPAVCATAEEFLEAVRLAGFRIERSHIADAAPYAAAGPTLRPTTYRCLFFIARKA